MAVNARDAMPDGGLLTIETGNVLVDESILRKDPAAAPGPYVLLQISDNGSGMDEDTLAHVFEPFFTTKEVGKGTGLGLATIYGIVKQNGGLINVESQAGLGTVFRIYLPRCFESTTIAEPAEDSLATGCAETVLLVEDDDTVRRMTAKMLANLGYRVRTAGTPREAISQCEQEPSAIHLLITDVVMPQMNGPALRNRLDAIKPGIKALYISGYTNDMIQHRGVLDEGTHFLQKPFDIKSLAQKVREALHGRG